MQVAFCCIGSLTPIEVKFTLERTFCAAPIRKSEFWKRFSTLWNPCGYCTIEARIVRAQSSDPWEVVSTSMS